MSGNKVPNRASLVMGDEYDMTKEFFPIPSPRVFFFTLALEFFLLFDLNSNNLIFSNCLTLCQFYGGCFYCLDYRVYRMYQREIHINVEENFFLNY